MTGCLCKIKGAGCDKGDALKCLQFWVNPNEYSKMQASKYRLSYFNYPWHYRCVRVWEKIIAILYFLWWLLNCPFWRRCEKNTLFQHGFLLTQVAPSVHCCIYTMFSEFPFLEMTKILFNGHPCLMPSGLKNAKITIAWTGLKNCKHSWDRWKGVHRHMPVMCMSPESSKGAETTWSVHSDAFWDHTFNSQQCRVHRFSRTVGIYCCNKHKSSAYSDFVPCLVTIWAHSKFDVLLGIKHFHKLNLF